MANVIAVEMTTGTPAVRVYIEYNNVNKRINGVFWEIPEPGIVCRAIVWDDNVNPDVPVIDRIEGQGFGAENIPGNYRMVEVEDPGGEFYMDLPLNIRYNFRIESV